MVFNSHYFQGKKLIPLFIFLFFLITFSLPSVSQESTTQKKPKLGSLEKSILIPGWGQMAEKRYGEGIAFFSLEVAALVGVFWNDHQASKYYRSYKDAVTVPDAVKYRELTEKHDIRRNQFLLAAGAVWALNLLDMYFIYQKKNKDLYILVGSHEKNSLYITIIKVF